MDPVALRTMPSSPMLHRDACGSISGGCYRQRDLPKKPDLAGPGEETQDRSPFLPQKHTAVFLPGPSFSLCVKLKPSRDDHVRGFHI